MRTRLFFVLLALVLLAGCASSGVKDLGAVRLLDGTLVQGVQFKNTGHSGPNVTRVESWRFDPSTKKSELTGVSEGSAPGLTETLVGGTVPAVIYGGAMIGAARVLRPAKTEVNASSAGSSAKSCTNASGDDINGDLNC